MRNELKARNVSYKGLKSQLVARLGKILKTEAEEGSVKEGQGEAEAAEVQEEKKTEVRVSRFCL